MTNPYDDTSKNTKSVFSRALEALNDGDFLEIKTPMSYLMKSPEVYEVVLVEGRKKLRCAERKPKGVRRFVLSLKKRKTETEENGFTTYKVDYTWELKEKEKD